MIIRLYGTFSVCCIATQRSFAGTCSVRIIADIILRTYHAREHVIEILLRTRGLSPNPSLCLFTLAALPRSNTYSVTQHLVAYWDRGERVKSGYHALFFP
jgi:hypothetical protein